MVFTIFIRPILHLGQRFLTEDDTFTLMPPNGRGPVLSTAKHLAPLQCLLYSRSQVCLDLCNRLFAIDLDEQVLGIVVTDQRAGLFVIGVQPMPYRVGAVIRTSASLFPMTVLYTNGWFLEERMDDLAPLDVIFVSIDAVGSSKTALEAIELLNKGGQALLFGVTTPEESISLKLFEIYNKEISLFGSFTNPHENHEAIKLLKNNVIDPIKLISHELSLDELEKGLELMKNINDEVKKIIIDII